MTWLLWRQHRAQGAVTAGLLAVLGLLLWITGVTMAHTFHSAMTACRASGTCDQLDNLFQGDGAIIDLVNITVLVPLVIGVFWGATIVGRELDTGTNRLVWTQSVTRRSWLRSKVALLLVSSAAAGAAVAGLVTWWSGTLNSYYHDRFGGLKFDIQGVVPIGYTVFAASLGLLAGVLWRRTLPAIATTVGGFILVRLLVENFVRPHFQKPLVATVGLADSNDGPLGSWVLTTQVTHNGVPLSGGRIQLPVDCRAAVDRAGAAACAAKHGYARAVTYQPAGRYWHFQLIELAIFLALAAVLTVVAVVALQRRQDA